MATVNGYAGASTTEAYGTHDWTDAAEAVGGDDSTTADVSIAATVMSLPNELQSYKLAASSFGLSVGSVSVRVSAVTASVRARSTADHIAGQTTLVAQLRLPDGTLSTPVSASMDQDNNFDLYAFGGDLWGFDASQLVFTVVESASLAVLVWVQNGLLIPDNTVTAGVDSVQLIVTYDVTPDEPPPPFGDDEETASIARRVRKRFFI